VIGMPAGADETDMEMLRREIEALRARDAARERELDELRSQLDEVQASSPRGARSPESALDRALEEAETLVPDATAAPKTASREAPRARLVDLSLDVLSSMGTSTATNAELETLQAGDHDPRQRGFTLQNVELSMMGAIDPYLFGEAHIIYFIDPEGESVLEVEEAFATTQFLPHGLQAQFGQFFTEFGRLNHQHPHAWEWQDQPFVLSRFFGGDGMRAPGTSLSWLLPVSWFSELRVGAQNARGETMISFLSSDEAHDEFSIGGRPFVDVDVSSLGDLVYLLRFVNGVDLSENWSGQFGVSGTYGPNSTGSDGWTSIVGADWVAKWRPGGGDRGWPFVTVESEVLWRYYEQDDFTGEFPVGSGNIVTLPSDHLTDWGGYVQALYGFQRPWAAGLRLEYGDGSGSSFGGRQDDPFRSTRFRASPLLVYQMSEFSRLRLQANYDRARDLDDDDALSFWLGLEFSLGSHAAHTN
jgi:hypothetical protein